MKYKIINLLIIFITLFSFLSLAVINDTYAQQRNETKLNFVNHNPTTWQVKVWYFNADRTLRSTFALWPTTYNPKTATKVFHRAPEVGEYFKWLTACVDPTVYTSVEPISSYNVTYYITTQDISCYDIVNKTYAGCGTNGDSRNFGNVYWNEFCPTNTIYCTKAGVTQYPYACNTNLRCGDGSYRCDRIENYCSRSTGTCQTSVRTSNDPNCVGVNGCCLRNSDCSGGSRFCGSGSNTCDRREHFCNSNNTCAVRTINTDASICAGENGCCFDDNDCKNNEFCRNPDPGGVCQKYDQISGRVFVDFDRNNKYDSGIDTPLKNATVQRASAGTNNWPGSSSSDRWITTNNSGYYIFDTLRNPPNQDVRIREAEFGLYDSNNCDYTNIIRSKYQGNVQTSPGHRRNNIDPTPNLSGVLFMLRYRSYDIIGTVYRDADGDEQFSSGDVRVNNSNIKIRSNESVTGDFHGSAFLYSGTDSTRYGEYRIPLHINGKSYDIALVKSTLPSGWDVVRSETTYGSNKINGVTINCGNSRGRNFLVTSNPVTYTTEPDLIVTNVSIPSGPVSTSATGSVTIENVGTAGTGVGFNIRISDNGGNSTTIGSGGALGAGANRTLSFTITRPSTPAEYNAEAFVDSGEVIVESDETNNKTPTKYEAGSISEGTIDLVVDEFFIPNGDVSTTSTGSISVANIGTEDTGSSFYISITDNGGNSITLLHPALTGGSTGSIINFTINIPDIDGSYTATAIVNSTRNIPESNTGNNSETTDYTANYVAPTYSIQGSVFVDDPPYTGYKESTESNSSGTLNVYSMDTNSSVGNFPSGSSGYTVPDLLEGSYRVTLIDFPDGYEPTYPVGLNPPPPQVEVAVGQGCSAVNHERNADCTADGNIINLNFGIRLIPPKPWVRGVGGDMRSDPPLVNEIPTTSSFYFSESNSLLNHGIIFGPNIDLGTGGVTKTNVLRWNVRSVFSPSTIRTSYVSVLSNLRRAGLWDTATSISSACGGTTNCNLSTASFNNDVYAASGSITFDGGSYVFPDNTSTVFMINGDLTITNAAEFIIPNGSGSVAIFIVNGNINISNDVIRLDGIYSTGEDFVVEGIGEGEQDSALEIQGSVIINASRGTGRLVNNRDLLLENFTSPSIDIEYRPDFVLNAPDFIKYSVYSIREVAPGSQ